MDQNLPILLAWTLVLLAFVATPFVLGPAIREQRANIDRQFRLEDASRDRCMD